jgi:thiol:disulfide interchange protein
MDYFEIFIDTPAWLLGQVIGAVIMTAVGIGSLLLAIYGGAFVYQSLRIPYVRAVAAAVVGIYLALILYRSSTWTAVFILEYIERNDE